MKRFLPLLSVLLLLALLFSSCGKKSDGFPSGDFPEEKMQNSLEGERVRIVEVSMRAQTLTFSESYSVIRGELLRLGGYVETEITYGNGEYQNDAQKADTLRSATLTLRVPAESCESFLAFLREQVNVTYESSRTQDVTEETVDLASRIRALEGEETALLKMEEACTEMNDLLSVRKQLSEVQVSLASLRAQYAALQNKTNYSRVDLSLEEVKVLNEEKEGFFPRLWSGIQGGFLAGWEGVQEFFIFLFTALPFLLVFSLVPGVIFCAIFFPIYLTKRKKKRTGKQEP